MELINGIAKQKAQKVISRIESAEFDEIDVDTLLMQLRAFSNDKILFREVADFVAHNDERKQGVANDSLDAFYLSMKFFVEYASENKLLNIYKPFPLYIKKLMIFQIDKCKAIDLKSKFSTTKEKLTCNIKSLFEESKKNNTAVLRQQKISKKNLKSIEFLLSFIGSKPAFTQEVLLDEILQVIRENGLTFDENKFFEQGDKIVLYILMLLHNTQYNFNGYKQGYSKLACENTSIPYNINLVNKDGNSVSHEWTFGHLNINGNVVIEKDGKDLTISYPLVSTNLLVEDWCDESLFIIKSLDNEQNSILHKVIDLDHQLSYGRNGKLTKSIKD